LGKKKNPLIPLKRGTQSIKEFLKKGIYFN